MRPENEGSACPNPISCIWRGSSFDGKHAFCALMGRGGNCLEMGCYVKPDGSLCEIDNSPEACERRLRAMERMG